jgi:hypothetical protein
MPSPPVITSIAISPNVVATEEPIIVTVVWTGSPQLGVTYQWRLGNTPIRGQTAPQYIPDGTEVALNCVVTIDNGYGTAIAIAIITADTEDTSDFEAEDFETEDYD